MNLVQHVFWCRQCKLKVVTSVYLDESLFGVALKNLRWMKCCSVTKYVRSSGRNSFRCPLVPQWHKLSLSPSMSSWWSGNYGPCRNNDTPYSSREHIKFSLPCHRWLWGPLWWHILYHTKDGQREWPSEQETKVLGCVCCCAFPSHQF